MSNVSKQFHLYKLTKQTKLWNSLVFIKFYYCYLHLLFLRAGCRNQLPVFKSLYMNQRWPQLDSLLNYVRLASSVPIGSATPNHVENVRAVPVTNMMQHAVTPQLNLRTDPTA